MKFEFFIAKRIQFNKEGERKISRPIVRLTMGGIALSLAVMILSVGIVIGFKQEVRNKLIGFGSHIQISSSFTNHTYKTQSLKIDSSLIDRINLLPDVKHAQQFATQPGIVKVNGNFQGVVLKGIDKDYDWTFFKNYLIAGEIFQINDSSSTNQTLISKKIADLLLLEVGDKFFTYFIIDGKVRVRPFTVSGIYTTGFSDYDKIFIIGDIKHIRKLNKWEEDECSGIEIEANDFSLIEDVQESLFNIIGNRTDEAGNYYMMKSIQQINPQIFGWLDLLNTNVVIILILMIAVASFTMISGLLILILDRTNMIGILKALGATNHSVKKIFLYHTLLLVGKGMAWGNIIALTLTIVQKRFAILKLDPEMYYVDSVPIELSFLNTLLVNIGTIIISYLVLRLSTHIITRIAPIKAIRFE